MHTAFKPKNCVFIIVTKTNVTSGELSVESIYVFEIGCRVCELARAKKAGESDFTRRVEVQLVVRLWDAATGAWKQTLEHSDSVSAVAFSPDGMVLASASYDKVRLWDATTGARKQTLNVNTVLRSLLFSEDGRYLKTDRGLLRLNSGSPDTCLYQEQSIFKIFVNDERVTHDGQNLLWLPLDYKYILGRIIDGIQIWLELEKYKSNR
jgi:hypothetical protein